MGPTVRLQPGETELFRETQRFWQNPMMAVLMPMEAVATTALLVLVGLKTPGMAWPGMVAVWAVVSVGVPGVLLWTGMTTVVTDRRLVVRWWPGLPGREIELGRIRSAEAVRYQPLGDAGGWGWRMGGRFHRVFNVSGDRGVHVRFGEGEGEQVLIGSGRAEALAGALAGAVRASA